MDDDSSLSLTLSNQQEAVSICEGELAESILNNSNEEHCFNNSNEITIIEASSNLNPSKQAHFDGSDSGVEVVEAAEIRAFQRGLSSNSQDIEVFIQPQSCDSSLVSCCSNYDEAYNLLVRRNSTLLDDYTRHGDGTSENGSESSSVSGKAARATKRALLSNAKKKVSVTEAKTKASISKERSRSKPATSPKTTRLKSLDRLQAKTPVKQCTKNNVTRSKPNSLDLSAKKEKKTEPRSLSSARTPLITPTDDGRWPSVNSKPAPLMSRSLRGSLLDPGKQKPLQVETKTIEKYATLPRRRKEEEGRGEVQKKESRDGSVNRVALAKKHSSKETPSKIFNIRFKQKVKIYHEIGAQTALTMEDVQKALGGEAIALKDPHEKEKETKNVQVDLGKQEVAKLKEELKCLTEKYNDLSDRYKEQTDKLLETEGKLKEEVVEKNGLREELSRNTKRVLALIGSEENVPEDGNTDSLLVLETRFQNVGQVIMNQEEEISRLHQYCRNLQIELEKNVTAQKNLLQQQQELEAESRELQEFIQAEKSTLNDALKEAEADLKKHEFIIGQKENEIAEKQNEIKHLVRLTEKQKQDNLSLEARLAALEAKSRELLVHQGSSVSGAAVALSALIGRLDGLVEELVVAYTISDQELDDVIFHNEAYNNSSSSPESTPEKSKKFLDRTPSPKKGSSFVSAVINAIKNAAAQSPFANNKDSSKDNLANENYSSNEMLDSETEPCLMMEPVLVDIIVPDGHSHNMISSGHSMMSSRLTHSESLKDLSQAIINRQKSEQASYSLTNSYSSDIVPMSELFPSASLVDQVIEVDNLVTRLLKVIRIIQIENDDCMNEIQDQRDSLEEQVNQQKVTNKIIVKQLKDWETLGGRLKSEAKELMAQLSRKNIEIENLKTELNNQREQVEKLNQDVCELSTALAKVELESKVKEEEVEEEIKRWEKTGETPTPEIMGRLISTQNEVHVLKEKLNEKEKQLMELSQEYRASRDVLTENLKERILETKKLYDAIDDALEVLHNVQSVVMGCPVLKKLQRDLEELNFEIATGRPAPPDCNANAGLLQPVNNIEVAAPINTTA